MADSISEEEYLEWLLTPKKQIKCFGKLKK